MKTTIAVTGAGGGVGQSVIKSLYNSPHRIVALDSEVLGAGLYAAPISYTIPYANDAHFIERLLDICKKENCQLLFPGLDIELGILSRNVDKFKEINTTVVVSRPEVVDLCDNKLETANFLSKLKLPTVKTINLKDYLSKPQEFSFPLIIKPQIGGARSKNVYKIESQSELEHVIGLEHLDTANMVIQEYIEGDEYTCGTINLDGKYFGAIIMRRILRDGDTYKCFTEENPVIEELLEKIMTHLKPFGACNVQLRLKNGIPYVFELNARCSGTTASRSLAGFNEPRAIADYLISGKPPKLTVKPVSVLRYWKELVVDNNLIETVQKKGKLKNAEYQEL